MTACGIFYDDGHIIRHLSVVDCGELLATGVILNKLYSKEEDVKKLFDYIWLDCLGPPFALHMIKHHKGKGLKFLTYDDVLEFIDPKETEITHYYFYKDKQWYYSHVPKKIEGCGLAWNELGDVLNDYKKIGLDKIGGVKMFLILWQPDATKDDCLNYSCDTLESSIYVLEALTTYHDFLRQNNKIHSDYMYTFQKYNQIRGEYESWSDPISGIDDPLEFSEYLKEVAE